MCACQTPRRRPSWFWSTGPPTTGSDRRGRAGSSRRGPGLSGRGSFARRLERPECQNLLSDFRDAEGRTLLANLEPWGQSPSQYMEKSITFRDGSELKACGSRTVFMLTPPGSASVFLCPSGGTRPGSRLARVQIDQPTLAEIMVIHEMLHTLGLGENPPTTFEITERVMGRCR